MANVLRTLRNRLDASEASETPLSVDMWRALSSRSQRCLSRGKEERPPGGCGIRTRCLKEGLAVVGRMHIDDLPVTTATLV